MAEALALSPILSESCWWITSRGAERRVVKRFDPAGALSLSAVFIEDERKAYEGLLTGARCQLPTGEVVEVVHRKTPLYDLCRELDRLGYGDHRIEISTPWGTSSMRGRVGVLAGLMVVERAGSRMRLEPYGPVNVPLKPQERDEAAEPSRVSQTTPSRCTDSPWGAAVKVVGK